MQAERRYWFRARRYGYGWTPSAWQGWAVVAVWIALVTVLAIAAPAAAGDAPLFALTISAGLAVTVALAVVCWKTGEPPRWRWGK